MPEKVESKNLPNKNLWVDQKIKYVGIAGVILGLFNLLVFGLSRGTLSLAGDVMLLLMGIALLARHYIEKKKQLK